MPRQLELGAPLPTRPLGLRAAWLYHAEHNLWTWVPSLTAYSHDLARIRQLRMAGFQLMPTDELNPSLLMLYGQLYEAITLVRHNGVRDRWASSEAVERLASVPVALAFAVSEDMAHSLAPGALEIGQSLDGQPRTVLRMAQWLPPPQFGESALVQPASDSSGQHGQVYPLSALGDDGLMLWHRMGAALKALAAPAEWWPHTTQLEACLAGGYDQLRDGLRSKLLAARGQQRETWRARLAQLEIDRKHAEALRTSSDRAQRDHAAWLERWQEVRQMAAELAQLYWAAHLQATSVPAIAEASEAQPEPVPIPEEANIIAQLLESVAATMDTTSYQEDRAVREASLAPKHEWQPEADALRFKASNDLAVYFLDREHPLSMAEAQAQLLRVTPRTVLTVRIAQGLWNLRRHDAKLGRNGQALIAYNEILQWRDVPKHSRPAYPGSSQRVTDGYRSEDREDVRRDLELASRYWLRGQHTVNYKGKARTVNVDAPYLHVAFISVPTLWGDEEPVGAWVGPGAWINSYEEANNYFLAEIDRRVFELHPHHEQHELKIALYLTERWREQAHRGSYAEPITMGDLLQNSVIEVDHKHLTERFTGRIEQAIETLRQRLGCSFECLTPVDKATARWGKAWLAARWRILPPGTLAQSYIARGITKDARQLPSGRMTTGKKPTRKGH